ncbi:unnamed protein product [Arabidopsis thaliana]|uniref:Uncharacterized protein n=1 Tax=Arabidopsis thaliana TaxID=3702 RepID=A0A5S9XLA8_ARATH|nr:unnamed protein product [Arabidopsis thaliana]
MCVCDDYTQIVKRDSVRCENDPPPENILAYAQSIANKCIDDCAVALSEGPYSENIAIADNPDSGMSGPVATKYWIDDGPWYIYDTKKIDIIFKNSCRLLHNENTTIHI